MHLWRVFTVNTVYLFAFLCYKCSQIGYIVFLELFENRMNWLLRHYLSLFLLFNCLFKNFITFMLYIFSIINSIKKTFFFWWINIRVVLIHKSSFVLVYFLWFILNYFIYWLVTDIIFILFLYIFIHLLSFLLNFTLMDPIIIMKTLNVTLFLFKNVKLIL